VVVEAHETDTIKAFEDWGFSTVKVPFRNFMPFGKLASRPSCDIDQTI